MEEIIKKAILTLLSLLLLVSPVNSSSRDQIELPDEAVSKKILDNGLTVLVKKSLPENLVVVDVKIKTGSSLEGQYLGSGISHAVEHMIFKGTVKRHAGDIEKEVKSYGGIINGSASQDITDFYIIVPSKFLAQAIEILNDMLLNARFDPDELSREKEVILKEMHRNEDEPQGRIMRILNEVAYLEHPYRYPTIGYNENLRALTSADLIDYYNTRYVPNRMIVTIIGDINVPEAISAVERGFKDFRRANYSPYDIVASEPAQIQPRNLQQNISSNLAYLAMGFHSTSVLSDDLYALDILSAILGRGDNSRLNTALYKTKGLVHNIMSWNHTPRDPGLFIITAVLDGDKLKEAEKSIINEIDSLRDSFVIDGELDTAKRMLISDFVKSLETIEGQAYDISTSYALTGSEKFSRRYIDGIRNVTKDAIRSAANKYLSRDKMTVVSLLPQAASPLAVTAENKPSERIYSTLILSNGIRVFVRQDCKVPSISITAAFIGGTSAENFGNNGISNITADMILRGTLKRPDSGMIKGMIEGLGGDIDTFSGVNAFGVNITVLRQDVDTALDLLRDILVNANFSESGLKKSKDAVAASIDMEDDDIFEAGIKAVRNELFKGSSYALNPAGRIESVNAISIKDVKEFYGKFYVPNNLVIAVSGDVDPEMVIGRISKLFSTLKKKDLPSSPITIPGIDKPKGRDVVMDKEESLIMLGFKTVSKKAVDRYSLEVLGAVMSGFSGRFFSELRNKLSLAYDLGCSQDFWSDTGMAVFYSATTKDRLPAAKDAMIREVVKIRSGLITDEELSMAKRELILRHQLSMQTNRYFTLNFAVEELRGLGYDDIYKFEAGVEKVTREDVKAAADSYLNPEKCVEVVISPSRH